MKKIIVIGCAGSGKSTFARKLRDKTGLPLFYLDMIWHKADRTTVSREEFDKKLLGILKKDEWIIDGNYNRTLEIRLRECDTVFLFDLPTEDCILGVQNRIGKPREDMPWVESELDKEFKEWIESFSTNEMPKNYELIERYKDGIQVYIFKNRQEADEFLARL